MELYPAAIDSDGEAVEYQDESSADEEEEQALGVRARKGAKAGTDFTADFSFDLDGEGSMKRREAEDMRVVKKYLKKNSIASTLEEKIAAERDRIKGSAMEIDDDSAEAKKAGAMDADEDLEQLQVNARDSLKEKQKKGGKKKSKDEEAFFEVIDDENDAFVASSFEDLNLSRPTLKAISGAGFTEPTPIQARAIPVALAGRDICACAATGTGKTGSFVIPIVERLLHRARSTPTTRVLILLPTRELAIQVFQVFRKLAIHAQLEVCLCAGGLDLKAQEAALRASPDVVVATPGRLIDLLHNTPTFTLSTIEVLVLDEADRMLEEAFKDQMTEIIRLCSSHRQTLLFSATMTDQIDELASMSLRRPIRIFINENTDTAMRLRQEFIRLRAGRETDREAIVAALVTRTFADRTLIFVRTKRDAMRLQIVLGLLGLKAGQMHSGLTQTMRVDALAKFKRAELDCLVSTDLASRGLDIEQVHTVINMHMPRALKAYIHRVGRTARAGKAGRSISLVCEQDRKLLKEIVNSNTNRTLKQRLVAPEVVIAYRDKITGFEESITKIEEEEKAEKLLRMAEQDQKTAEIRLGGGKTEREGRVWFKKPSELDKIRKKEEKLRMKKLEAKKAAAVKTPEDKAMERLAAYQVRNAKRAKRPARMRAVVEDDGAAQMRVPKGGSTRKDKKRKASSFTSALTDIGRSGVKKARHGPDDLAFRNAKIQHKKSGAYQQKKRN